MIKLLTTIILLGQLTALQAQTLTVNTGFTPPVANLLQQIMQLTFERAGIDMRFTQLHAERSMSLVSHGIDDAECCRIPSAIAEDYPNLLRVPEMVYLSRFSAFSKKSIPEINGFDSLKPYTVATVAGWKILVINLEKNRPELLHIVDSADSMFQLLHLGRIDIATYGYLSGLEVINKLGFSEQMSVIDPPLVTAPLYLFLNPKHKALVPVLTKALRELKAEGKIQQIIAEFTNNQ